MKHQALLGHDFEESSLEFSASFPLIVVLALHAGRITRISYFVSIRRPRGEPSTCRLAESQ
jgi:hypothetical protein